MLRPLPLSLHSVFLVAVFAGAIAAALLFPETLVLVAALAVVVLATVLVYRRTVGALARLSDGVRAAAAGAEPAPLPAAGPREVRDLAGQINALTQAVRRSKEDAERANEAKSRFLSHMSHELRTPLAAVLGFAELLHRQTTDEKQHEWSGYILDGGRHLLALVNELLEISRIEAGKVTLAPAPVELRLAAHQVLDLVRPLAEERGIALDRSRLDDADAVVLADPMRLKQVLLNVVANAIKYNRDGGSVTVTVELGRATASVAVTDTGVGIPPERIEQLFNPFERLGADAGSVVGSGLGLAVTKGLVETMGGRLTVESEAGAGSTFTIELPLAAKAAAEAPPQPATAGDVLYVDDAEENLELVERILLESRPGLALRTTKRGTRAVDLAHERRPDLLLLDLNLPDITGEEVLRRLRARGETAGVPVIVLTADSTTRNITRLLESGADAYLTKPVDVAQLLTVVDRLLVR